MGKVVPFSKLCASFDPETLNALGAAYDRLISRTSNKLSVRESEAVALRMIEAAKLGQRGVEALYAAAMSGLGAKSASG